MSRYGQRPENALKRANEFIEVGKPARALDTLYEVFKNKKWAYNWSENVLEPIMFKYLELCVELKKSHIAKEGLFQYRNMFQSVNVGSLENVIRGYLRSAEERTESAREQSQQAVIDIDDLDNLATPESILLSAVSGEDAQDRSDRTILTPWVKFLWESYCQCLELLRTNAHVETLYHDIAKMAFNFCLKYNRKTEFRKLCDKLRKHLEDIAKLPTLTVNVSLSKPETQQYNLETRLVQLDSAIQMELWQEAYKATEDIHNLMMMSKKSSVPKTMANYYQKLAMVFWKAGYYLFHAAALFKLFQLNKEMKKNITSDELQRMASLVLLATLSVPLPSAHPEFDRFIESDKSPLEKAQKLSVLLGLQQPPTRQSLLKELVRLNILNLATPHYQNLYNWLEVEFNPLELCSRVDSILPTLEDDQYTGPLKDVTLVKLILQVCQVYQTITFERLMELTQKFATPFHMERLLVECVRHNDMQIRVDHGAGCIHFGIDLSESQREDKQEGPLLQLMPSEQIRNQLINMSSVLFKSMKLINPTWDKKERNSLHMRLIQQYHNTKNQEHMRLLARHKIIEDRKEYLEKMNTERENEEARRQEEMLRQQYVAEQERLEYERKERERKRIENELQIMKQRNLQEKVQQISQTSHGQKILKKLDEEEMKNLDADQITARELEELQKERRELQQKLKSQEKKMDYFERAKRQEEIPLTEKAYEEKKILDRKLWEERDAKRIAQMIEERNLAVAHRERLKRMKEEKEYFMNKLLKERLSTYETKLENFEKRLAEERKKRLAKRKQERKRERQAAWQEAKEAEERKRREEEEEKRLEEERKKREEELKRRAEREESLKKLAENKPEPFRPRQMRENPDAGRPSGPSAPVSREPPTPRIEVPSRGPAPAAASTEAPATNKYVPPSRRTGEESSAPPQKYIPPSAKAAAVVSSAEPLKSALRDDEPSKTEKYKPPTGGSGANPPPPSRGDAPREGVRFSDQPRGGGRFSEAPREGGRFSDTPRDGGRFSDAPRDSGRFSDAPRDGGRFSDASRDGGRFSDASRDGGRFSDSPRDGGRFSDAPRDGPSRYDGSRSGSGRYDGSRGSDRFSDGQRSGGDRFSDGQRSGGDRFSRGGDKDSLRRDDRGGERGSGFTGDSKRFERDGPQSRDGGNTGGSWRSGPSAAAGGGGSSSASTDNWRKREEPKKN